MLVAGARSYAAHHIPSSAKAAGGRTGGLDE